MTEPLATIVSLWAAINIMALLIIALTCIEGANFSFVNPIIIYRNIKVNWFGALFLTIIFNIFLPAIAIPYWIYKVCTVGRK